MTELDCGARADWGVHPPSTTASARRQLSDRGPPSTKASSMSTQTGPTNGHKNHGTASKKFFKKRPSEWTRKEAIQFAAPLIIAIAAIAIPLIVTQRGGGASGGGASGNGSGSGSPTTNLPSGTYRTHLGRALTLNGAVTVQLTRIADPATGDSNFLKGGDRYLAAEFRVSDPSAQPVSGLVLLDSLTTVVGSDGQTYSADQLDTVSECTSFHNGPIQIVSGQSVTGCAVFQIPTGVSASEVQVIIGNERGIWSNP